MRCAHAHSYNLYRAQRLPQGSSLKKKSVSGGSVIRGKSVKEELNFRLLWKRGKCVENPVYQLFVCLNLDMHV